MKISTLLLTLVGVLSSCVGNGSGVAIQSEYSAVALQEEYVEVLYFHGKLRCVTCNAIEKLTKEVVNGDFAQQLKDGQLVLRVVDISTEEGAEIADRYEVSWSSLFVNGWKDTLEERYNMTDFGFSYAKKSPQVFKEGLKKRIDQLSATINH